MTESVEGQILRVGADVAPRLTPDRILATIAGETFHRLTDTLTVCVLTLRNGFTVTGESACASPANYNQEVGERVARENAVEKIWLLEGYLLKQRLFEDQELHAFADDFRNAEAAPAAKPPLELGAPASSLTIGGAIDAVRAGKRVARAGWNGKGMFLYFVGAGAYPAASDTAKAVWGEEGLVPYLPYIAMRTVTGEVVPWLCSQTDLLAVDWTVVE